jgi:hypothetical protein
VALAVLICLVVSVIALFIAMPDQNIVCPSVDIVPLLNFTSEIF